MCMLIRQIRIRPIVFLAIIVIILDVLLVRMLFTEAVNVEDGSVLTIEASVKSMTVKTVAGEEVLAVTVDDISDVNLEARSVLCYFPIDTELKLGQRIRARGSVALFQHATNPGQFDYAEYNFHKGVSFAMFDCRLLAVGSSYSGLRQSLYEIRLRGEEILAVNLPGEDAAIMKAMLFGNKGEIDSETKELFTKNGIAHILAISGLHISFLAMSLYKLLRKLGIKLRISALISEILIILYGFMVGFPVSAFRAIFMFSLFLVSRTIKRSYDMLTAMSLALIVLVITYPPGLFDTGLIMSFLAVLGVGFFGDSYLRNIWKVPDFFQSVFISVWISLCSLPVMAVSYYEVPIYSLALNLLVIPLMSLLLTCGVILVLCPVSSVITARIIALILYSYKGACAFLENTGMGRVNVGAPKKGQVVVYYILLVLAVWWPVIYMKFREKGICRRIHIKDYSAHIHPDFHSDLRDGNCGSELLKGIGERALSGVRNKSDRQGKSDAGIRMTLHISGPVGRNFITGMIVVLALFLFCIRPCRGLNVYMLDVGQGDCMIIRNDNKKVYVIDGGSSSVKNVGEYRIIPCLKWMGVGEIEAVFITHPDSDHMNGLLELLEQQKKEALSVKRVYVFAGAMGAEEYEELSMLCRNSNVELVGIGRGDVLADGELRFSVLSPGYCEYGKGEDAGDGVRSPIGYTGVNGNENANSYSSYAYFEPTSNNASLVMHIEYKDFDMLTTGDVEEEGEQDIMRSGILEMVEDNGDCGVEKPGKNKTYHLKKLMGGSANQVYPLDNSIDVLKVAHHGSSGSSSLNMLSRITPRVSLISVGERNRYGHPHAETLERLEKVGTSIYRTDQSGAIIVSVDGADMKLREYVK